MVAFEAKEVIRPQFLSDEARTFLLAMQRIGGDQTALQGRRGQFPEQGLEGRNLVALFGNRLLGHGQPQVVLGFCAPRVLELALQLDPELCALLPLQGSVREIAPGQVRVALQDPMGSVALCRSTEWQGLCKFHYGRLRRVVDRLMLGPPGI